MAHQRLDAFAETFIGGPLQQFAERAAWRSGGDCGLAHRRAIGAQLADHLDRAAVDGVLDNFEAPGAAIGIAQSAQCFVERKNTVAARSQGLGGPGRRHDRAGLPAQGP